MARKKLKVEDKPGFDRFRGSLRYRFTYKGVRRAVYGKTEEECHEKERALIKRLDEGVYKPGKNLTLSEYFERWTDNRRGSIKGATISVRRTMFKELAGIVIDAKGNQFGRLTLSEVTSQDIIDMRNVLRERFSSRTTNECVSMLNTMFKTACIDEYIVKNPCTGIKSLKRTEPPARDTTHRALTREETAAFLEAASGSWYRNLYIFLLHTGVRIGEAGAILPGDIGPDGVTICRTLTKTENGGLMIGSETKTAAGRRFIPLDPEARAAIENQQELTRILRDEDPEEERTVFRTVYGRLLNSCAVNVDIGSICRAAGVVKFTAHALRDTFATRCVESGMQPKVLQEIMGHTNISMTMNLYAHAMDESKIEQIKAVSF